MNRRISINEPQRIEGGRERLLAAGGRTRRRLGAVVHDRGGDSRLCDADDRHGPAIVDVIRLYGYHAALLCALLAAALMRWDGLRIPRRFVAVCIGLGLLIPAVWPDVHPVF